MAYSHSKQKQIEDLVTMGILVLFLELIFVVIIKAAYQNVTSFQAAISIESNPLTKVQYLMVLSFLTL